MADRRTVWAVVVLIGGYIALQLIADITAAKIVSLAGITIPAGTFVYALTFTWRDLLHKKLGKEWARAAIVTAAGCNLFMVLYFVFAIRLPAAPFWPGQEAFAATLGVVWRIAVASILAEVVSELVDTEIYHRLAPRFRGAQQWVRVLGSNGIATPVDSLLFVTLAFAGTMPVAGLLSIAWGQTLFKWAVALVSMPGIYAVREEAPVAA